MKASCQGGARKYDFSDFEPNFLTWGIFYKSDLQINILRIFLAGLSKKQEADKELSAVRDRVKSV